MSLARSANCLAFVDSSGLPLSKALSAGPDLVKVNREEAEVVTGVVIRDAISAARAARKFSGTGAKLRGNQPRRTRPGRYSKA